MDSNLKTPITKEHHNLTITTTSLHRHRHKVPLRRRKPPSVRLGGKKSRKFALTRVFKRVRIAWLKIKYVLLLKKLKKFYKALIRDIIEGSAALESKQQRVFMESAFGIPVMTVAV